MAKGGCHFSWSTLQQKGGSLDGSRRRRAAYLYSGHLHRGSFVGGGWGLNRRVITTNVDPLLVGLFLISIDVLLLPLCKESFELLTATPAARILGCRFALSGASLHTVHHVLSSRNVPNLVLVYTNLALKLVRHGDILHYSVDTFGNLGAVEEDLALARFVALGGVLHQLVVNVVGPLLASRLVFLKLKVQQLHLEHLAPKVLQAEVVLLTRRLPENVKRLVTVVEPALLRAQVQPCEGARVAVLNKSVQFPRAGG
mmetsp:Transcript_33679/g.88526  ORF Transcript_33679/g.88526 Transcript_33679/m.88526 type:complete len:256 (-) Transcript_33679:2247-3014(-)